MKYGRLLLCVLAVLVAATLTPRVALGHEGQPLAPHDVWQAWNWEPFTLTALIVVGLLYGRGLSTVWREAGVGRGIAKWRVLAFTGGLLTVFVALLSPLEGMANVLFSAHMVQHLLLLLIAPPLLLLGQPDLAILWALPAQWRRGLARWTRQSSIARLWRALSKPVVVWLLYALGLWIWHLPALYQAALRSEAIHMLEHATFFGAALLMWWTLAHSHLRGSTRSYAVGILFAFTTALHGGLLGWLLTFTTQVWYPVYAESAVLWGLAPLEDQQLAGAIMWAPAGLVYALAALTLLAAWMRGLERMTPQAGRQTAQQGARGKERAELFEMNS